jgi:hypothetical protein
VNQERALFAFGGRSAFDPEADLDEEIAACEPAVWAVSFALINRRPAFLRAPHRLDFGYAKAPWSRAIKTIEMIQTATSAGEDSRSSGLYPRLEIGSGCVSTSAFPANWSYVSRRSIDLTVMVQLRV